MCVQRRRKNTEAIIQSNWNPRRGLSPMPPRYKRDCSQVDRDIQCQFVVKLKFICRLYMSERRKSDTGQYYLLLVHVSTQLFPKTVRYILVINFAAVLVILFLQISLSLFHRSFENLRSYLKQNLSNYLTCLH